MFSSEIFSRLERGAQVVLRKDAAAIIGFTGLQAGDRVVDAGAGSGFLSISLGSVVAPTGKVFSYEWKDDFFEIARKNVSRAGLEKVVEVKYEDVLEGIAEKDIDLVTLDLANSDKALAHAFAALKPKGYCVGILPNVEQAKRFTLEAEKLGFASCLTTEIIERRWLVREEGCRPETTGVLHTAFLTFARKPGQA